MFACICVVVYVFVGVTVGLLCSICALDISLGLLAADMSDRDHFI